MSINEPLLKISVRYWITLIRVGGLTGSCQARTSHGTRSGSTYPKNPYARPTGPDPYIAIYIRNLEKLARKSKFRLEKEDLAKGIARAREGK